MPKLIKTMCIAISCILLLGSFWMNTVSASEARDKTEILQNIDEYMNSNMNANLIKAASLSIVKDDEIYYATGYGTFGDNQSVTGDTPFPIASLSKSFTALAVLQLADHGQIDLDAAYASYVPVLSPQDPRVHDITVRHLLNQTSGLNDTVNPDMTRTPQLESLDEANQLLTEVQLSNNPGAAYSYHNPNYTLLANLVENVSGERFSDYLRNHMFEPLGMADTYNVQTAQQLYENEMIPVGHYLSLGRSVHQAEPLWFIDGPAGIVSTAEDMSLWMLAQFSKSLLSPTLMEEYHTMGASGPYGLGWLAGQDDSGGQTLSHSGIFWTYKAEEKIYIDEQMGITVMFNSGLHAFVNYSAFIDGIANIMRGDTVETSYLNARSMEMILMVLIFVTLGWGIYGFLRIRRRNKRITFRKMIVVTLVRISPTLILLFLSPLMTFVGGGRVLPWFGIWTTLSTIIVWLVVLSLVNLVHLATAYFISVRK